MKELLGRGTVRKKIPYDLTIIMYSNNNADALVECIDKAQRCIKSKDIRGEIVIADGGSSDASVVIAGKAGIPFVTATEPGYGSAVMVALAASNGAYIVIADVDGSYDFMETLKFFDKLRDGYDLVQGCRLSSGGGNIRPGAMRFAHRWIGNPLFSFLARHWLGANLNDIYCAFRGFRRDFCSGLALKCTGREFAAEMIFKGAVNGAKLCEVPITLHQEGLSAKGRSLSEDWQVFSFFLLYSHKWMLLMPGVFLALTGLTGFILAWEDYAVVSGRYIVPALLISSALTLCGLLSISFSAITDIFAVRESYIPYGKRMAGLWKLYEPMTGLLAGLAVSLAGLTLFLGCILSRTGPVSADTFKLLVGGVTLFIAGLQWVFAGFMSGALGISRKA
jgi:glycosyltransferase involved in cell wall biosynthesis